MSEIEFVGWPKIKRANRIFGRCIVTEKIDGTNAHILIHNDTIVKVGSRTRWITPENDNFGFAKWVKDNEEDLLSLGNGHHFGEWYGGGIQRGYGLNEKRFALFNSRRWNDDNPNRPKCCESVKEIYSGDFNLELIDQIKDGLKDHGSYNVPGWMDPEGFIVYLSEIDTMIKWTYDYEEGKWANK